MSLLNLRKKNIETKAAPKKEGTKLAVSGKTNTASSGAFPSSSTTTAYILIRPRITEKAAASAEKGAYVFEVAKNATKRDIAQAVRAFYKVNPTKVTIVAIPPKKVIVKGRRGIRSGGKKAYVFLKKGEKIEVV